MSKTKTTKKSTTRTPRRRNPAKVPKVMGIGLDAVAKDLAAGAVGGLGAGVLEEGFDRYVAPAVGANPMLGNAIKAGGAAAVILLGHKLAQKNKKLPAREAAIGAVGGIARGLYDELIGGSTTLSAAPAEPANGWDDDDYFDVLDDDDEPMAALPPVSNDHMLGSPESNAHMLGMAFSSTNQTHLI